MCVPAAAALTKGHAHQPLSLRQDEIRHIVARRRDFESKIARKAPALDDFLRYADYEKRLDRLRRRRKHRLGIRSNNGVSDHAGRRHIHFIYERMLRHFPHDVTLWMRYIGEALRSGSGRVLGRVFVRAIQYHPTEPALWLRAAHWEWRHNRNAEAARTLLQRALRILTTSADLWCEYVAFELKQVEVVRERRAVLGSAEVRSDDNEALGRFLGGEAARLAVHSAVAACPQDLSLRLRLWRICRLHPFAAPVVDDIEQSLQRDFPDREDAIAAICLGPWEASDVANPEKSAATSAFTEAASRFESQLLVRLGIFFAASSSCRTK